MLVTADWVLPIASPPIRNGAVLIASGRIAEVGPTDRLVSASPNTPHHDYPGCVIVPGLVNAHTHLALTCLKDLIPSQPFAGWIRQIPVAVRALDRDDIAASIAFGAARCVVSGTTVVGDIADGPESAAVCADAGLGGAFYWELLGIGPGQIGQRLETMEFPAGCASSGRFRYGLSPHAPYTSGPQTLVALREVARSQGAEFAVHAAESAAEEQVMRDGSGPLADLANRLAYKFTPPGFGSVRYLSRLRVLDDAVAIHCTQALPVDTPLLARRARGVVLCPRSNAYLQNGAPPVGRLLAGGVRCALGTDSLASNSDLDLLAEARALREIEPALSSEQLVRMITEEGAHILGLSGEFGALAPDYQADLAIYRLGPTEQPYDALVANGGRSTIEAVLTAGVWRVLEGQPTFPLSFVEHASTLARTKAAVALGMAD